MASRSTPGVFCLEGPWSSTLTDESSVRPLLDLLRNQRTIRFIYRDVATIEEFEHYMSRWTQGQYNRYGFGYFAFHGKAGAIHIGRKTYSLEDLSELLSGRCRGRVLYFASCATLDITQEDIERFRIRTKARAVCGFTKDVEWVEAAAFEMLLIYAVTYYERIDAGFNWLRANYGSACERLGLRQSWQTTK